MIEEHLHELEPSVRRSDSVRRSAVTLYTESEDNDEDNNNDNENNIENHNENNNKNDGSFSVLKVHQMRNGTIRPPSQ